MTEREGHVSGPETAGDGPERSDPASTTQAVESMLQALPYGPEQDVLVRLARDYARLIDRNRTDPDVVAKLGPKLADVCAKLGVKPAGSASGGGRGRTTALSQWRAGRADGATA